MEDRDLDCIIPGDFQIEGGYYLARMASTLPFDSLLDIGFGNGAASRYFRLEGKTVVAIDRDLNHRSAPVEEMRALGIDVFESSFEAYRTDKCFDAIWLSHVLEHTLNIGDFLQKVHSLLTPAGWLFVMVPPFKHEVVGGHLTPGWNLGILMYVLLVSGFDIKRGHFVRYGYNICGFVQKSEEKLPLLSLDQGDIERTKSLWPIDVYQGFDGNIESVNWLANSILDD